MITRVIVENFKRFENQGFPLEPVTVLAGPNNSGKTTLIQALSVWSFVLDRWRAGRGAPIVRGKPGAVRRLGQPIARKDFTPLPLGHFSLLWNERATQRRNKDKEGSKLGKGLGPLRPIRIRVEGVSEAAAWGLTVELRYQSSEVVYVNPLDYNDLADASVLPGITHCPAFSGIGAEETRYDPGFRSLRIGEGKPGDILRSVLLDVSKDDRTWRDLAGEIKELFQVELKKPEYNPGQPFILCEYKERGVTYDIASAGSGFHQTLLLFAFVYGNGSENSVLMVDEPDAHLHVWLQARIADRLSALARDRNRQLILSTHAETILGDTEPSRILSFAGSPHLLSHKRDTQALGTAMRLISPHDLLLAEHGRTVLYCDDNSDFKILPAWAHRLDHPAKLFFGRPFFHPLRGT